MAIPFYSMDLSAGELASVFTTTMTGTAFTGPQLDEYKKAVSSATGAQCISVFPSARTGFYFLLKALFRAGDEVLVSAFSFPLYVRLMIEQGLKPVFVDVSPDTALIDANLIENRISSRAKGILVTHLFGNYCDLERISAICAKHGLYLIEDCAHSFGSQYGKRVDKNSFSIFSTSPMKIPTTLGGGFVATDDEKITHKLNQLYAQENPGYSMDKYVKLLTFSAVYYLNSYPIIYSLLMGRLFKFLHSKHPAALRKLFYSELVSKKKFDPFERSVFTNMQGAVGLSQVKRNAMMIEKRRRYAAIFDSYFAGVNNIHPLGESPDTANNFLYYIVKVNSSERLMNRALDRGLYLMRENVWNCNAYDFSAPFRADCPIADHLQQELIRIPNSSLLCERQITRIARIVVEAAG